VISVLLHIPRSKAGEIFKNYLGRVSLGRQLTRKVALATEIDLPGAELQSIHKKYLRRRKFSPDFLEKTYGLRGTGVTGDWKFRIIIPFYFRGQLVSYQGRDITGRQELRYKTLAVEKSIVDPKHLLYNIDNCREETICVVEGAFDAMRLGPSFAATFGTSMTEFQIKLLAAYRKVIFLFDPEPEAQAKADQAATKLSSFGCKVEKIDLEIDRDPAELTDEEALELRRELLGHD